VRFQEFSFGSIRIDGVPHGELPWNCRRLVIGAGAHGALPVMDEVRREATRRHVELLVVPTARAIEELQKELKNTNAILHVTC